LRLVLLVAHTPQGEVQHRYVVRQLLSFFPEELVAIVVATGVRRSMLEKARRWMRRYTFVEMASRCAVHVWRKLAGSSRERQDAMRQVLFPNGDDGVLAPPDLRREVRLHNSAATLALIEELRPDIVAVYGTLVLGRKLIAACPRLINLHTGLSPWYRGSDTIFWPLHDGVPHLVGVTVHRLEAGLDSGPILARGRPPLRPGDNEASAFAHAVELGAELLCRALLREMDGVARPQAQNLALGREYRSVERSLLAEWRCHRRLRQGLLAGGTERWVEEF
jgi:methionyl-tRNA formyltransferase